MKQPNLYPSDPKERVLAERVVTARMVGLLREDYRKRHQKGLCDPMEGFCAQLTSAFFFATGGQKGPYALFRIAKGDLGGEDTHYFLVDTRKLPRGWQKVGPTKAFVALGAPTSAVVDLTASQFTVPIPYRLGRRVALSQRKGGDVEPTQKTARVLERAGLLKGRDAGQTFFHVTSKEHLASIRRDGIAPSEGDFGVGIYLWDDIEYARRYAREGGNWGLRSPVILEVSAPSARQVRTDTVEASMMLSEVDEDEEADMLDRWEHTWVVRTESFWKPLMVRIVR